jgi:hypothetical protein
MDRFCCERGILRAKRIGDASGAPLFLFSPSTFRRKRRMPPGAVLSRLTPEGAEGGAASCGMNQREKSRRFRSGRSFPDPKISTSPGRRPQRFERKDDKILKVREVSIVPCPSFGTRTSVVQIHSPRPFVSTRYSRHLGFRPHRCGRFCIHFGFGGPENASWHRISQSF